MHYLAIISFLFIAGASQTLMAQETCCVRVGTGTNATIESPPNKAVAFFNGLETSCSAPNEVSISSGYRIVNTTDGDFQQNLNFEGVNITTLQIEIVNMEAGDQITFTSNNGAVTIIPVGSPCNISVSGNTITHDGSATEGGGVFTLSIADPGASIWTISGPVVNGGGMIYAVCETVNKPDVNPIANVDQCGSYTLPAITGTDLVNEKYYDAAGGPGAGVNELSGTINAPYSGTVYAWSGYPAEGDCFDEESFTLTLNETPTPPTSASVTPTSVCADDAGNISLTAIGGSGTTLTWYSGSCGGTLVGTGTPLSIASPTTTTTYYARWESGICGNSDCVNTTVTVNPSPTAPTLSSNSPICSGDNAVFTITGTAGDVVIYTEVGGSPASPVTIGAVGTVDVSFTAITADQTLTLTDVSDGTCNLAINVTETVTVNPLPTAPTLSSNSPICSGDNAVFTITGTAGDVVTYTGAGGSPVSPVTIGAVGTVDVSFTAITADQTLTLTDVSDGTCNQTITISTTVTVELCSTICISSSEVASWLKADQDVFNDNKVTLASDGDQVELWGNIIGASLDASQTTASDKPIFRNNNTDNVNFNPVVDFDGTSDILISDTSLVQQDDSATIFVVALEQTQTAATPSEFRSIYSSAGGFDATNSYGYDISLTASTATEGNRYLGPSTTGNGLLDVTQTYDDIHHIYTLDNNNKDMEGYRDALSLGTTTIGGNTTTDTLYYVGGNPESINNRYDGTIGEIIHYNRSLLPLERQQINSYLAVKYGISLGNTTTPIDYISGVGDIVWTADAVYQNDVFGIGRNDCFGLHQQISQSINDAILTVSTDNDFVQTNGSHAAIPNDSSFLMFGSDAGNILWTDNNLFTSSGVQRLERSWKVQKTGIGIDSVFISLDKSTLPYIPAHANIYLLIDKDGDFKSYPYYGYQMTENTTDNTYELEHRFYDGDFFTVIIDYRYRMRHGKRFFISKERPHND